MGFNYKFDCHSRNTIFVDRDNIHDAYFANVRRFPLLTEEEERKLLCEVNNAETEEERNNARNKLIECNLRFVISVAKKIGTKDTFLDLVSEGNIGLMNAIEKYDLHNKCRLITYAISWILVRMQKYQVTKVNAVVPPNALKLHNFVKSVTRDFLKENERNPTHNEIADMVREKFDFNISNLADVELSRMISIEEKYSVIDEDETIASSNEYIARTNSNNVQDSIDEEYKRHKLDFFLGKLSVRERFIVERRYGIGCLEESYDTIGLRLDLGGERVRQICNAAVKKMQKYKEMVND